MTPLLPALQKVVSLAEAVAFASAVRAGGGTVGLVNGAFDLLHVGHLRYLEAARSLVGPSGAIVAAVNSDGSVKLAKGTDRPWVPQAERAELLAGLAAVARVVIFEEADAAAVIRALRPELHIKGTDYRVETVAERELVEALGGRVAIAGDPKVHSTTALAARLRHRPSFASGVPSPGVAAAAQVFSESSPGALAPASLPPGATSPKAGR